MERVKENKLWSLFCPDKTPGLADVYGDDFKDLYTKYEKENRYIKQMNARDLWMKILDSQMETGTPYLLYKDACNKKSNQKNLGTIKSSNLCTEIIEYSDKNETAVCNLASIALSMYVNEDKTFNYDKLYSNTKILVTNLNNIIDINYYPTLKTERSNLNHRPIGIGVQGLADTFFKMDLAFTSDEAKIINKMIFETIYYAALERSNEIAKERYEDMLYLKQEYMYENWSFIEDDENNKFKNYNIYNVTEASIGATINTDNKIAELLNKHKPIKSEIEKLSDKLMGSYSSFNGSPMSEGLFQFDLWNEKPIEDRYDWNKLKQDIIDYGLRNSLLTAPMPTASTSQILGNNECFEPITSNIYSRSTLAGQFVLVNKYLVNELIKLNLWNESIKNNIIQNKGSIQHIEIIPSNIKNKFKTVWELPMKDIINMSKDRGIYICQSQSLNLWMEEPDPTALTNMHFYSWKIGLKTGIYYLRRKARHQAQQFTIEPKKNDENDNDGDCLMCGS
jgi:ribonucleotide reductase alpha subunit